MMIVAFAGALLFDLGPDLLTALGDQEWPGMPSATVLVAVVFVLALAVSAALARARGIGPLVSLGLALGLTVGITATLLATSLT